MRRLANATRPDGVGPSTEPAVVIEQLLTQCSHGDVAVVRSVLELGRGLLLVRGSTRHERYPRQLGAPRNGTNEVVDCRRPLAYVAYQQVFEIGSRFQGILTDNARPQRPLWASTGVKDPTLPDTLYVSELVAPNTVNTMPEKTMDAFADHGEVTGDTITGKGHQSQAIFGRISALGIDLTDVFLVLENEGVQKFEASWAELFDTTREQLAEAERDRT